MRGLLVGRFQPFHNGHLAVIRSIRRRRPSEALLLGIGSAQVSHTRENPFTAGERFEMIVRSLEASRLRGVLPVPIVDVNRHSLWVAHVRALLPEFGRVYTNNPLTRLLFERDGLRVESPPWFDREEYQGTVIRERLAAGGEWESLVPPAVARYLTGLHAGERLRRLVRDDRAEPELTDP